MVAHDGVTKGGIRHATKPEVDGKPDTSPASAFADVTTAYRRILPAFRNNFASSSRILPVWKIGYSAMGTPNTTAGAKQTPWIWATGGVPVFYEEWKRQVAAGDAAGATATATFMQSDWNAMVADFGLAAMKRGKYGPDDGSGNPLTGLSDDSAWVAHALCMLHEVFTAAGFSQSAADVLGVAVEFIPATTQIYRDNGVLGNQPTDNPIVDYGVSTPGGIAFKSNQQGILYDQNPSGTFGYIAPIQEMGLAYAAHYLSALPTSSALPATLKAAFGQYAKERWQFSFANCRTPAPDPTASSPRNVQGLYYASRTLARNAASPQAFHTPQNAYYGRSALNLTALYQAGSHYMAALGFRLYEDTGDVTYLAEAKSICNAYVDLNGFGRLYHGVLVIQGVSDAWGNNLGLPEMVRLCLAHTAAAECLAFKAAILNTARNLARQTTDGFVPPTWGGPESTSYQNVFPWPTWEQVAARSQGGVDGGGQGRAEQLPCSGGGMNVIQAGVMVEPLKQVIGSGPTVADPINIAAIVAEMAALRAAVDQIGARQPYYTFGGQTRWAYDVNNKLLKLLVDEGSTFEVAKGNVNHRGDTYTYAGPGGQSGSINSSSDVRANGTVYGQSALWGGALYLGTVGGNAGLSLGGTTNYINGSGTSINVIAGGGNIVRFQSGNMTVFGGVNVGYDILPTFDGAANLGTTTLRFKQVAAQNATIQTSDERDKDWLASGLSDAEYRAGLRVLQETGTFRWTDNPDRIHWGVRAQQVWRIFIEEGLIPSGSLTNCPYSMLCWTSWPASPAVAEVQEVKEVFHMEEINGFQVRVIDVEHVPYQQGRPARAAGDRYGVREEIDRFLFATMARLHASDIQAALAAIPRAA
jgi:hypothetical protein